MGDVMLKCNLIFRRRYISMPKVSGTRKMKAADLWRTASNGPSLSIEAFGVDGVPLTPDQRKLVNAYFIERYKLWSETWVLPRLQELIPELKDKTNG